jgi:predicted amidohydrolase YtcJ
MKSTHTARVLQGLFVLVLLPGGAAGQAAEPPADLVIVGGRIFTGDEHRPWAEALAIRGEWIVAVGDPGAVEALAGPATRRIDVEGRLVIPGINDAHVHSGLGVAASPIPGVGPQSPLEEVLDSLASVAARTPPGQWIAGNVGVPALLVTGADRFALDRVAPDHPVYLLFFTGHGLLLNSRALLAMGIAEDVADPPGGWHVRIAETGELSGMLHGYANFDVRRRLGHTRGDADQVGALRGFAVGAAALGITTVQDMPVNGVLHTRRWLEAADVPIRWRLIDFPFTGESATAAVGHLAVKWVVDGTPVEGGILTRRPHGDRPGHHGGVYLAPDQIRSQLAAAVAERRQILLHVAGDSTLATVISAMEALAPDSVWRALRVRIEHGDHLAPDQIAAVRRLGMVPVQNPSHLDFPELLRVRFPDRVGDYQPLRSLVEAGIPLALGSDGPLNPYLNILWAATHANTPSEALSVEQALRAYTWGSAYAEHTEHEKGTLAVGMLADLAVLSQDIFTVPLAQLPETRSVLTLVDGRVVHDALEAP